MLPIPSPIPLLIFACLVFAASLYGLAALGHFPRKARDAGPAQGTGPIVLWVSIAAVAVAIAIALLAAWLLIPWYAAVIAGGAAILIAPLALQYFSDEFVDGRSALIAFAGGAVVLALALLWYIGR